MAQDAGIVNTAARFHTPKMEPPLWCGPEDTNARISSKAMVLRVVILQFSSDMRANEGLICWALS
ncbi:hypothetical protein N7520_004487 [Penicillium odoratum]|uniref:uncharacterized protein n=1 Tax=Penicillium odoratum TaxID=1167516 RepID=UPI0025488456|nr:uncharacterized protein N7520_004487 [Penicillium odoratum]KAJ5764928.1 hypothetical protein N7520_004487 [Penicillium odoratum]